MAISIDSKELPDLETLLFLFIHHARNKTWFQDGTLDSAIATDLLHKFYTKHPELRRRTDAEAKKAS